MDAQPPSGPRLPVIRRATAAPQTPADKVNCCSAASFAAVTTSTRRGLSARRLASPATRPHARTSSSRVSAGCPEVKCGDCTNQAFRRVDDAAVVGHLRGRHVMGVYPMLLDDETCWFLAVDFDKSTWQEDVRAFVETARRVGLPAPSRRSRPGNGAHVWFFFSGPSPQRSRGRWAAI